MYKPYRDEVFGLWGLMDARDDDVIVTEPEFATEGEAQRFADAYNNGCTSRAEAEEWLDSVADAEPIAPEWSDQEWFESLRYELAGIQKAIQGIQADQVVTAEKIQAMFIEFGVDDEAVSQKRQRLLTERGLVGVAQHIEEQIAARRERAAIVGADLQRYALHLYDATGEKHLGGVDIQAAKEIRLLVPEDVALEYGRKWLPNLVETVVKWTNKRSFFSELRKRLEKHLDDEVGAIVEVVDNPTARVADDLSAYLPEPAVEV